MSDSLETKDTEISHEETFLSNIPITKMGFLTLLGAFADMLGIILWLNTNSYWATATGGIVIGISIMVAFFAVFTYIEYRSKQNQTSISIVPKNTYPEASLSQDINSFEVVNTHGDFKPIYKKAERADSPTLIKSHTIKNTRISAELIQRKKKSEASPSPKISIKLSKSVFEQLYGRRHKIVGVNVTNESAEATNVIKITPTSIVQTHYHSDTPFPSEIHTLPYHDKGFPLEAGQTTFSRVAAQSMQDLQKIHLMAFLPQITPIKYGLTVYSLELTIAVMEATTYKPLAHKKVALFLDERGLLELKEIEAE